MKGQVPEYSVTSMLITRRRVSGRINIDYFMESARVRYLRTSSFWRIRKRMGERSERVSFLIQKQRVCKYRTKHFPCCNLFISHLLRFSTPTRFSSFIRQNKYQVMFLFRLSLSTWSLLQTIWNIFRNVYLASPAFDLFPLPCSFKLFASSFQTLPCLVKLVVVEKGLRHIRLL